MLTQSILIVLQCNFILCGLDLHTIFKRRWINSMENHNLESQNIFKIQFFTQKSLLKTPVCLMKRFDSTYDERKTYTESNEIIPSLNTHI